MSNRKQRQLIEEDKIRKRLQNRIEVTPQKNGNIGASPSEKRDQKFQEAKERQKQKDKERKTDLVKKSKLDTTTKKTPFKKEKSELQKGLDRVEQIKKQQAADEAAFKEKVKKSQANRKSKVPRMGVITGDRASGIIRGDITKKMNMGGVMKNRGGTFKGTF